MEKKMIGIFVASLHEAASEMLQSLCSTFKENGYCSLVIHTYSAFHKQDGFDIGERNIIKLIPYQKLRALILLSETIKDDTILQSIIEHAAKENIPVISLEHSLEGCHCIQYDIATPFAEVVDHIFTHHQCKRVAFIAGFHGNPASEERLDIYLNALKANGIAYEEELVQYGCFWELPTIDALNRLLAYNEGKPPIEAIICANDTMAMTVVAELNKLDYTVPGDILVTGCDGIAVEQFFMPRLTTAACDYNSISLAILRLLTNPSKEPTTVTVPYVARISQSCGCKPIRNPSATKMLMNLIMHQNSMRSFRKELHEMTLHLLDDNICSEDLAFQTMRTGWGMARYQTSLVLFYNTLEGLGIFPRNFEVGKNAYEFCRWCDDSYQPSDTPFSPKELLPALDEMYDHVPSKAIMLTLLHEQASIFGYFLTGFEPNRGDFSLDTLDYNKLLDYQMSLSHIFSTLMHRRSLMAMNNELERLYVHDSMTGVFNRRGFFQRLNYLISQATSGSFIFFAAIDMDDVKYINDTFGHGEGDFAITAVANMITEIAPKGSAVARFGGDEFMVGMLFPDDVPTFPEQFRMTMEHAVDALNAKSGKPYSIGASCGIEYCIYNETTDIDQLMKSADNKLYVDKARHKCLRGIRRKP